MSHCLCEPNSEGGIHFALAHTPVDEDLTILTDSLSAIHLLCHWHRKRILTPYVHRAKCRDIVSAILEHLLARTRAGTRTLFAKVRAHNSCELNAAADRLAAQGATLPTDQGAFAESTRDSGLQYAKWDPASPLTVSTADARTAGLLAFPSAALRKTWSKKLRAERCTRTLPSYTADFLRRRDDSRDMLGRAFQDLPPGTIKKQLVISSLRQRKDTLGHPL